MFNNISRQQTRALLLEYFPDLVWLYDHLYPPGGNTIWFQHPDGTRSSFKEKEGHAQGCPLSPFFACLVLHKLLQKISAEIPKIDIFAYMDDNHHKVPCKYVSHLLDLVKQEGPPPWLIPTPHQKQPPVNNLRKKPHGTLLYGHPKHPILRCK